MGVGHAREGIVLSPSPSLIIGQKLMRHRRKKCDSVVDFPCGNCKRLGLSCDTSTKLLWEDDSPRDGMRRRGPSKHRNRDQLSEAIQGISKPIHGENEVAVPHQNLLMLQRVSEWPFQLDGDEVQLLSHYIHCFSRTYPTFGGSDNPFLKVVLPLCVENRAVLDAALALSGVQSWENGRFAMEQPMLRIRHQALKGCNQLITKIMNQPETQHHASQSSKSGHVPFGIYEQQLSDKRTDLLLLLMACGLLLLYEKISAESQDSGTRHIEFFTRVFPEKALLSFLNESSRENEDDRWKDALSFLSSLFLYNDLIRSTSLQTPTLSRLYYEDKPTVPLNESIQVRDNAYFQSERFLFPSLVARISSGDATVTDEDIAAWGGGLDWFPSYALLPPSPSSNRQQVPTSNTMLVTDVSFRDLEKLCDYSHWDEGTIVSELYRIAATVYRKQNAIQFGHKNAGDVDSWYTQMGNLPAWAVALIHQLPPTSILLNTLLWPLSIIAKELTDEVDRKYVISRLGALEKQFKMRHFFVLRDELIRIWAMRDQGVLYDGSRLVLFG